VSVHTVPNFVDNHRIFDAQGDFSQQKAISQWNKARTLLITRPSMLISAGF
jgi:hypothetical protein